MAEAKTKEAPAAGGDKNAIAETAVPAANEDGQNGEKLQQELAQLTNIQRGA